MKALSCKIKAANTGDEVTPSPRLRSELTVVNFLMAEALGPPPPVEPPAPAAEELEPAEPSAPAAELGTAGPTAPAAE